MYQLLQSDLLIPQMEVTFSALKRSRLWLWDLKNLVLILIYTYSFQGNIQYAVSHVIRHHWNLSWKVPVTNLHQKKKTTICHILSSAGSFESKSGKPFFLCLVPCTIFVGNHNFEKQNPSHAHALPTPTLSWQCTAGLVTFDEDILQGSPMRHGACANSNSFSKASM